MIRVDEERHQPGSQIVVDHLAQCVGSHREVLVVRHRAQAIDADAGDPQTPRLTGWWGNESATRFQMAERFEPGPGADGWRW